MHSNLFSPGSRVATTNNPPANSMARHITQRLHRAKATSITCPEMGWLGRFVDHSRPPTGICLSPPISLPAPGWHGPCDSLPGAPAKPWVNRGYSHILSCVQNSFWSPEREFKAYVGAYVRIRFPRFCLGCVILRRWDYLTQIGKISQEFQVKLSTLRIYQ